MDFPFFLNTQNIVLNLSQFHCRAKRHCYSQQLLWNLLLQPFPANPESQPTCLHTPVNSAVQMKLSIIDILSCSYINTNIIILTSQYDKYSQVNRQALSLQKPRSAQPHPDRKLAKVIQSLIRKPLMIIHEKRN